MVLFFSLLCTLTTLVPPSRIYGSLSGAPDHTSAQESRGGKTTVRTACGRCRGRNFAHLQKPVSSICFDQSSTCRINWSCLTGSKGPKIKQYIYFSLNNHLIRAYCAAAPVLCLLYLTYSIGLVQFTRLQGYKIPSRPLSNRILELSILLTLFRLISSRLQTVLWLK